MKDSLAKYVPIADAVARIFQPHVEVVLHDIETDKIAYIANPYSGRKEGDLSLLSLFDNTSCDFPYGADVEGPYENAGNKGQRIRSISAALKDDQGNVIGMMCTNLDFSALEAGLDILENFIRPIDAKAPPKILFQNDWRDNIRLEIRMYLTENNLSFDNIDAGHRKSLIKRLEEKGLFYARKSVEQLAGLLNISRATAYKDLKQIRKENEYVPKLPT